MLTVQGRDGTFFVQVVATPIRISSGFSRLFYSAINMSGTQHAKMDVFVL